jgi:hypothetical protein
MTNARNKEFDRGYLLACATIVNNYGSITTAADTLNASEIKRSDIPALISLSMIRLPLTKYLQIHAAPSQIEAIHGLLSKRHVRDVVRRDVLPALPPP